MRNSSKIIAGGILFLSVIVCFAWEQESNEFQFPDAGVKRSRAVLMKGLNFSSTYNRNKKMVHFSYSLPQNIKEAVLNIYSVNGSLVKSFKLENDTKKISWNVANGAVAMGTYAVSLKCGEIEKNLRILVVK